ncbi:hypothetical protein [Alteromonas hispanica]|uniref:Uncharacterized protein n=1 Tax=Alteromonas hispanica TaxID=315421 RepID=A0A6L9MWN3_9ALTE|nr:hypothetical protein [Alteromonas hispanica]NDW22556.1 hypothetical protein [Alteromonas hispanica]
MTSDTQDSNQDDQTIGNFAAVKTSIANGDVDEVKARLDGKSIKPLEKGYLIDIAKLSGNSEILKIIEATPESE